LRTRVPMSGNSSSSSSSLQSLLDLANLAILTDLAPNPLLLRISKVMVSILGQFPCTLQTQCVIAVALGLTIGKGLVLYSCHGQPLKHSTMYQCRKLLEDPTNVMEGLPQASHATPCLIF
jgi:hypothetical protein